MKKEFFGKTQLGNSVHAYTMTAGKNSATVLDLGGILQKLTIDGCDIVAGYDSVSGYQNSDGYLGALIGRYANRIAGGTFVLNEKTYHLNCNEKGVTCLHGGNIGFDKRFWNVTPKEENDGESLVLELLSPDGEEHFPGTVHVTVTYTVTAEALAIHYQACTTKDTPFNMTNHSYFNLNGYQSGDVYGQILTVNAKKMNPVNAHMIPVGEENVAGTPFDFTAPKAIGKDINADDEQLMLGCGYDHNFILDPRGETVDWKNKHLTFAARVSGSKHEVTAFTDLPGIQIYTANFMGGKIPLKGNTLKINRHAVCLETQFAPDGPNKGEAILRAGDVFDKTTLFILK